MKLLPVLALASAVAACQPSTPVGTTAPAAAPRGLAFAQGACGGCHAVERYGLSPNPNAPPFPAIVNREGLTPETLTVWLRDAHNYPEEMEFSLEGDEVDEMVAYLFTLRDPKYRPAI